MGKWHYNGKVNSFHAHDLRLTLVNCPSPPGQCTPSFHGSFEYFGVDTRLRSPWRKSYWIKKYGKLMQNCYITKCLLLAVKVFPNTILYIRCVRISVHHLIQNCVEHLKLIVWSPLATLRNNLLNRSFSHEIKLMIFARLFITRNHLEMRSLLQTSISFISTIIYSKSKFTQGQACIFW